MVSPTAGDDTGEMGYNPHRRFVARRADYVVVVLALVVAIALVAWALLG
jgi:hypothetical protein